MKSLHSDFDSAAIPGEHDMYYIYIYMLHFVYSILCGKVSADKHSDAAKRYYRSSREEYSRQRRGISILHKDNRRREEHILRVCMYTFIYCGIFKYGIHNSHTV